MQSIHISQIQVSKDRQRMLFEMDKIADLALSMETYGLLHPIVVRKLSDGTLQLMAGERRLRAAQVLLNEGRKILGLDLGHIAYSEISEIDDYTAKNIELEENIRRVDLTWQELAKATAQLHALRKEKDPNWTLTKTTQELKDLGSGTHPVAVRNRILLAEHMDSMPEVKKAPTEAAAVKEMTRALEKEFRQVLATKLKSLPEEKFYLQHMDALEGLRTLAAESIDIILTDPPYGINAEDFNIDSVIETHGYKDDWESVQILLESAIQEFTRVAKPQCHLYMFCDYGHIGDITSYLKDNGWEVWKRPLLWVKNTGYCPQPNYGPRRHYECVLFANKGKKMVNMVASDVIICPAVSDKLHAAEKPVPVLTSLLKRSSMSGDVILDPFAGSGSIFEAAYEVNCRVIAFESDAATFQIAFDRKEKFSDA